MINQFEIRLPAFSRGIHLITGLVEESLQPLPEKGMLNIFVLHTSAGLTINENADPSVRHDLEKFFDLLAPEHQSWYRHTMEGADGMPAHIKSVLTGPSLTIPITNGRLNMGTWQGIYLCEFRNYGGRRRLLLTIYG